MLRADASRATIHGHDQVGYHARTGSWRQHCTRAITLLKCVHTVEHAGRQTDDQYPVECVTLMPLLPITGIGFPRKVGANELLRSDDDEITVMAITVSRGCGKIIVFPKQLQGYATCGQSTKTGREGF